MGFGAGIVGKRGLGAALMGELTVGNDGINEPLSTVGAEGMRVLEIASVGKLRLGASGKAESRFVLGTVYSKLVGLSVGRRTLGAEGLRKSNEGGVGFRKSDKSLKNEDDDAFVGSAEKRLNAIASSHTNEIKKRTVTIFIISF